MIVKCRGSGAVRREIQGVLRRLPALEGEPVRVHFVRRLRDRHGEVHAGAFLRQRRIACAPELRAGRGEFARIFCHELFHFVWLRLGNPGRRAYEALLAAEWARHARGELGWSAEWRKRALSPADVRQRTRRWREYCCESFCDTAAWLFASRRNHPEFTLAPRHRAARREWFARSVVTRRLSI